MLSIVDDYMDAWRSANGEPLPRIGAARGGWYLFEHPNGSFKKKYRGKQLQEMAEELRKRVRYRNDDA